MRESVCVVGNEGVSLCCRNKGVGLCLGCRNKGARTWLCCRNEGVGLCLGCRIREPERGWVVG